ncbi:MAG: glutamate synthase subunit beta [Candidatus Omnitrophota bacterium]
MGKPTGFKEFKRELPKDQPVQERITHWREFHLKMGENSLKSQAGRCMDCGTPFCHVGTLLAGMAQGCPLRNLIPEWNDLVYKNLWRQALDRLHKTNNFPEFTGRVCPAPCEGSCVLGIHEPQVTIKNIEVSIIERAFKEGWVKPERPRSHTGKKVAVVGSGPAGLAAAMQLNRAGHRVTVYERADRVGGLLMYGIPNMKLDKTVVVRRIDLMQKEGVEFVTGADVGRTVSAKKIYKSHDALLLCGGATQPRDLPVEGRSQRGIYYAMEYLQASTAALLRIKALPDEISAKDRDVVVIGGGDTGTDCVATAIRQNCRSLVQLEIMPRPPSSRAANNPWPEWPKLYKMDYGQEEAAGIFGQDPRLYQVTAQKFSGDEQRRVREVSVVGVEWRKDAEGRYLPAPIAGTEKNLPAQLVLLAMGFAGPEEYLLKALSVARDPRSNVSTSSDGYATSIDGVFAAGDMRRGQSLVVWAIHEGRCAARAVDEYLMGSSLL